MKAVFKHELNMMYHSMSAYIFGTFLLVFTGIGAMVYNLNASVANFEYVLSFIEIIFIVLVPLLTMRVIAEERRAKTDQLLFSLPVNTSEIVLGKFFSLAVVFGIPTGIICIYPIIFSRFGEVYLPTSYGSLVAFYLMGLALMSIGVFISSLTESQGMAAGICVAVMIFNYYCATLADYVSTQAVGAMIMLLVIAVLIGLLVRGMTKSSLLGGGIGIVLCGLIIAGYFLKPEILEDFLPNLMHKISIFERLDVFVNGIFDLTGIIYFVSIIALFLFLCVQVLEKRRYQG